MTRTPSCQRCLGAGHVAERYCDCESARWLRARIEADPRVHELRAKIERLLGESAPAVLVTGLPEGGAVLHRVEVEVVDGPAVEAARAYEAAGVTWAQLRAARRREPD